MVPSGLCREIREGESMSEGRERRDGREGGSRGGEGGRRAGGRLPGKGCTVMYK